VLGPGCNINEVVLAATRSISYSRELLPSAAIRSRHNCDDFSPHHTRVDSDSAVARCNGGSVPEAAIGTPYREPDVASPLPQDQSFLRNAAGHPEFTRSRYRGVCCWLN